MTDKLVLSNSAIETAMACPARFYWRYERKIEPFHVAGCSPAFVFGEAIHLALEARGKGSSLMEAIEVFKSKFGTKELSPKHTLKAGELILREYYRRYERDEMEILESEYPFLLDMGTFFYRGRFDKVVREGGKIMILDHKTSSSLGNDFIEGAKPNCQFTGYIFAADCEFKDVDTLIVDGILTPYPYKSKPLETDFQRIHTYRTELELELWGENLHDIVSNIYRWRENKKWPKYDKGYNCGNKYFTCDYRDLCTLPLRLEDIDPPEGMYCPRKERG